MRYPAIGLGVLATFASGCGSVSENDPHVAGARAISALIVWEAPLSREGVGKISAIRVVDPEKLLILEAFFPGYSKRPSCDLAGGWKAGYEIYFNFPKGETGRLTVSKSPDGQVWSAGRGDFATKGEFAEFVTGLVP